MTKRETIEKKHQENCKFLTEIGLPDSIAWMDSNLPGKAYPYICETDEELKKAMFYEDEAMYDHHWQRYNKAWIRIWQLMAKEHFHSRDIYDVDMRYFRHLPDGYSFVMDSSVLKCEVLVLPRKPKKSPDDMRYVTAGELIKIHENPAIMKIIIDFDAWFTRDGETGGIPEELMKASRERCEEIMASGGGLKLKRKKGGWDHYE